MNLFDLTYQQYGEKGILISWPSIIDNAILEDIVLVKQYILTLEKNKVQDITNGYNSVLVLYKNQIDISDKIEVFKNYLSERKEKDEVVKMNTWEIPVCYHESFGKDITEMARIKNITVSELIELHTAKEYKVFCKGFLPGFMYLGGLDSKLNIPRKVTPKLVVPKNSVAIGGEQTGIYPCESPGGWYIIGRTPISLFNVDKEKMSLIAVGDTVRFKEISLIDYLVLENNEHK